MDLLAAISDGGRGDCHSNFGADESTSDIQEVSCVTDRGAGEGKRRRVDVKQQYACKVGVGVQGIAIAEAEGILGAAAATTLSKTCCFCSCAVGEPDRSSRLLPDEGLAQAPLRGQGLRLLRTSR